MPPKKSVRITLKEQEKPKGLTWQWKSIDESCYYGYSKLISSDKIASFDMDSTLIETKSGGTFAKNAQDWRYWDQKVPAKLKQLEKQGYKLVIFTNQMGVSKGKANLKDIQLKIQTLARDMGVQLTAILATKEDKYRKPGTGMWDVHIQHCNGGKIVDKAKSFYCGDAAGRKDANHKDFSDADLKYALNLGVQFQVPETTFLGQKKQDIQVKGFNPKTIAEDGVLIEGKNNKNVDFVQKQMIIFCGSPGSGKSTFWNNYIPQYVRINRDTLKTKQKCYKAAEQEIVQGKSVVIDNTNPKKQDRKYFIDLAKKYDYKVRCFFFKTPKDVCFHNDYQRKANSVRKHFSEKAGSIPIHSWFKYVEQPQLNQGFYEINKVNFLAKFTDKQDREAYHQFSKK